MSYATNGTPWKTYFEYEFQWYTSAYNTYFVGQTDDLELQASLINWNGGSKNYAPSKNKGAIILLREKKDVKYISSRQNHEG